LAISPSWFRMLKRGNDTAEFGLPQTAGAVTPLIAVRGVQFT
jgi:hypothetical protein